MRNLIIALILMVLCFAAIGNAGEKEDLQKDIQIGQLTLQNMGMQMQILQDQFPKKKAEVEAMMKKYQELEKKDDKKPKGK